MKYHRTLSRHRRRLRERTSVTTVPPKKKTCPLDTGGKNSAVDPADEDQIRRVASDSPLLPRRPPQHFWCLQLTFCHRDVYDVKKPRNTRS